MLAKRLISVGELTLDVGETTSSVGELVVGELTRWRNDRYSFKKLKLQSPTVRTSSAF